MSFEMGWKYQPDSRSHRNMDACTTWMGIVLIHYILGWKGIPIPLSNGFHPCRRTVNASLGWLYWCMYDTNSAWVYISIIKSTTMGRNHPDVKSIELSDVSYFQAFISYHIPDLVVVYPALLPRTERAFVGFSEVFKYYVIIWYLFLIFSGYFVSFLVYGSSISSHRQKGLKRVFLCFKNRTTSSTAPVNFHEMRVS